MAQTKVQQEAEAAAAKASADAASGRDQEPDGVTVSAPAAGDGVVISGRGQTWDDSKVPEPNARKSVAEDPTGEENAKLVKSSGKK